MSDCESRKYAARHIRNGTQERKVLIIVLAHLFKTFYTDRMVQIDRLTYETALNMSVSHLLLEPAS